MSKTAQNLKDYFTTDVAPKVAAGTLLFTTMFTSIGDGKLGQVFGASTAHAQDGGTQVVMALENPNAVPVAHSPRQSFPVPAPEVIDTSKPWERKAAYRASTGRIVLHYGEGIREISLETEVMALAQKGYPAIAVPGGTKGQIELFIDRSKFGFFGQDELDGGVIGGNAMSFYDEHVRSKTSPGLVSLAK